MSPCQIKKLSARFLGITLDTVDMKASLPLDKLQRIREITRSFCAAANISKHQLLSLLGHLNFAMRVIPQGRSFINCLLDMMSSVPNLHDLISLHEGCCSDLRFWSDLLNHCNSITLLIIMDVLHQLTHLSGL